MSIIPDETRVYHMDDLKKRKVVEHNDLITSVAKMDKVPLKIFELAVSCIDTENPPKDNTVYLSKEVLFNFFDVSDTNKHNRFKEAVERMQKQAYFQVREKKGKGFEFESIVPIPYIKWNDYNDNVLIEFNRHVMPYLIDMKTNFTQYAISDIMGLNSKYSIILYKWLCMHYNQFEHYQYKGTRTQKQMEEYQNPVITMIELREITDTTNEYKKMSHFTERVLNKAMEEINEFTHFNVTYEKIKKGRTVDSLKFHITKKKMAKNSLYKEEEQDLKYLQAIEDKEQEKQRLYFAGMQSKYTTLLLENFLLSFKDTQDTELIIGLQANVYPLYDELKSLRGFNGVKEHISYVVSKQMPYTKNNIAKYLKVSIETYLVTVKIQDKSL
ncbi:RepB family plasmid replication initiator protein [Enterococcus faecalis]|uniref:RepB family plasmid replication initiator protein n=1 Tax=Enterococcus faecium TaxID=1352 RepID=UPI001EEE5AD5|nr:RepB family plasmid replication initiator protein [Enterococcus faecium]EKZ0201708.1 RepB family plasmid replication initiator protein [Enterococcus faecalis]MCF8636725.1 RepB family plasmid replication initiator protein [Enterococcus faecium]HAQ5747090.1 RepB family plasmid replication initiator protein [Enterococcus faecium]